MLLIVALSLGACASTQPRTLPPSVAWEARASDLQRAVNWQLDGRAAVAFGTQGWQATLDWRQSGAVAEAHLAGPFGVGALVLKQGPDGISLNGAPPSDAVMSQLQERLGFELPLQNLRYWLLGVPDPGAVFDLSRNDQDRAKTLSQAGWQVVYDRYTPVEGDLLPARVVLSRDDVRVRVIIDHWNWPR
ncbi:MAG TPA: lipoprotein insertase outer membrane protein LolB [Steroidobacteraceae bacterium]